MTIDLPIHCALGWDTIKATLVNVAPHLTQWTFALHETTIPGFWNVSNVETGCHVKAMSARPTHSITLAERALAKQTDDSFAKAVAKLPKECRK